MTPPTTRIAGSRTAPTAGLLLTVLLIALTAFPAGAQPGVNREQMWYAPTAEDWKKPCLIRFQRTWEDAVAVSKETGKAILICVNMDGEIASEHYAGIRYRMPEIAELYEPYVCVIASTYRHTPRDHDDQGRRILCPRFGSVTCGEHITIEPGLYEKYFDGQRVAPRHVMIELDGSETYDVYYAFDTDSVFQAITDGIENRANQPATLVRGDRPILERVQSRDIQDREAVEKAYQEGDAELRRKLLEAIAGNEEIPQTDLLRLAVFGFDTEMSKLARKAMVTAKDESTIDLIPEALKVPMEAEEKEELLEALKRLGDSAKSQRGRWLSVVHRGLATNSSTVNVQSWSSRLEGAAYTPAAVPDWMTLESRLEDVAQATEKKPTDPAVHLEKAEAALAFALEASNALGVAPKTEQLLTADPATARILARSKYVEARRSAEEAHELGEKSWRVDAVLGLVSYYLGDDIEEAYSRCEAAVEKLPAGATDWNAMAVLTIFAEGRFKAIKKAIADKKDWSPQWLTDVHSAYTVLLHHPMSTDTQVVWHHDFLVWLGARDKASRFLSQAVEKFPESSVLHFRLRQRILRERRIEDLENTYARMLEKDDASDGLRWFAGLASFVSAEFHRRGGRATSANESYERAVDHYEQFIQARPEARETADPYVALAMAGRGRIAFEAEEYEQATEDILAAFERYPDGASTLDGLNLSAVDTAKQLRSRLREMDRQDLVDRLQAGLDKLDPQHLELPAYEQRVRRRRGQ